MRIAWLALVGGVCSNKATAGYNGRQYSWPTHGSSVGHSASAWYTHSIKVH